MPLPKPHDKEAREDFMMRCMDSQAAKEMDGTNDQKVAACERSFDEARKSALPTESFGTKTVGGGAVSIPDVGKVRAIVATFDEVDNDGDVILSGAVPDGMKVTASSYNHDTVLGHMHGTGMPDAPPVAKGIIRIEGKQAVAHLDYFMETQRGREAFLTVKAMGADQPWSFAYHYDEQPARPTSEWESKGARRMLTKLGPLLDGAMEVSPVKMPGGVNTGTLSAKGAQLTASVDGHDHPIEDFAAPIDPEKPSTWKLPIFDADHVRNALARFNQTELPEGIREEARRRILAAAHKFGVDAASLEPTKKSASDVTYELRVARAKRVIKG